jgi:hydrogenase-1 operon protein HyaF
MVAGNDTARQALRSIEVRVEQSSGNLEPLLNEIRHAVAVLLGEGRTTCIDLKGIPLAPGEEERILEVLGTGEARVELSIMGSSQVVETSFPGVWVVTHHDAQGALLTRFVEIARVPDIVCSQDVDIAAGLARLTESLAPAHSP